MFDGEDIDPVVLLVDAVDHPVVAAACAVQAIEPESEGRASPVWVAASDP
jgi:hypothetical protein